MEENKFEKSVQREMKDFKLKPSEDVWAKVEERIREKKKRRVFFILFFLFGFALLGYWQRDYFFGGVKRKVGQIEKSKEGSPNSSKGIKDSNSALNQEELKEDKSVIVIDKPILKTKDQAKEIKNVSPSENSLQPSQTVKNQNSKVKEESGIKQQKTIIDFQEKKEQKEEIVVNTQPEIKKDTSTQIETAVIRPITNRADSVLNNPVSIPKEEIKKETEISQNKSESNNLLSDTSNVAQQKNSSLKKWKWGFLFTPGTSSFDDGIFSLNMSKSLDYAAGPLSSGSGTQNIPAPPSSRSAGFAFQTGTFLYNQLKPRVSFSVGLQYAYYSEHISVGTRNDSVLRNARQSSAFTSALSNANFSYSAAGAKRDFTNNYHFIEIPAIFQFQLNKKKTSPFNWTVGLSVGQLISAQTVAYDTAFGGIYYDNKKNLNKTQFSLTTGFNWGFFNNKKIKGSLGPVVDFHFNSLLNNELEKSKHLLFAGLRSTISFSGK